MSDDSIIWRVNRKPRFPVLSLGEYMACEDGPRQTMRRNMKYERIAPTLIFRKVAKSVASYLCSPIRDRRILDRCRDELEQDRDNASNPTARDNAQYAIRALEAFERSLNALPVSGMNITHAPMQKPTMIEGVKVSIQPTALIRVERSRGKPLRGAIIVDTAKGQEPKTDEAKAKATAGMTHAAYLLHDLVANSIASDTEKASTDHCMIFHSHRPELVCSPSNYRTQLRNVEAACRDIAGAWDAIQPPSSFDPKRASYRD